MVAGSAACEDAPVAFRASSLEGIELSVFVLTDGSGYRILPEAKDYKRIGEGDTGPNTGGMGAVSPVPFADGAFIQKVVWCNFTSFESEIWVVCGAKLSHGS